MKAPSFVSFIFAIAFPFLLQAQENNAYSARTLPEADMLSAEWSRIEHFDYLIERFTAAWEEHEMQSLEDIRTEMLKDMEFEVKKVNLHYNGSAKSPARANREKTMRQQVETFREYDFKKLFAESSEQKRKSGYERLSDLFSQYRQQLVEEYEDLAGNKSGN